MFNEMYGLDKEIRSFAVDNQFVETMNKGCFELGRALKPFCFFPGQEQENFGVVDLTAFAGLVDSSKPLIDEVADFRREQYRAMGFGSLPSEPLMNKLLFIDYLMSVSICYIEIPRYITKNGVAQRSFDKCLVTKNPYIMAEWMGCNESEMQAKYSRRIASTPSDFINGELKAVKLTYSAKGNSIVCPRGSFQVKDMVCTPLFMVYAFMVGAFTHMEDSIVKFTYLKDNGTIRELATTVSRDILMDYYHDSSIVDGMLGGTDMFNVEQGGLMLSSKQSRGYVKVPELGSSRYDLTGVRALNLTRILKAEIVSEVDRSFVDVDISSVIPNFEESLGYAVTKFPEQLPSIYKAIGVSESESAVQTDLSSASPAFIAGEINKYVETMNIIFTTTFQKQLHLFMIGNPQWFPTYTGKPNSTVTSSVSFGVSTMDF